jgi:Domain of unknown function (DUF4129)
VLTFALGSLGRGTPGGSLLFQSYWLLYLIYLAPIAALGLMIVLIVLIAINWRTLGEGIGFGLANKRKMQNRRRSKYSLIVNAAFWALALGVLILKKGTIFNPNPPDQNIKQNILNGGTTPTDPLQASGILPTISNIVQNSWFSLAFVALLVVAGLVVFQSIRVAVKTTGETMYKDLGEARLEGLQAVHEAMKLVADKSSDPRSRIILCYQHMLSTVSRVGVPVSSDQTARELERAIRSTFSLKGPATSDLTQLFEEARYSLHEILDADAAKAQVDLESIATELKIQLND